MKTLTDHTTDLSVLKRISVQSLINNAKYKLFSSWKIILLTFLLVFTTFIGIYIMRRNFVFPPDILTRDPMAVAKLPFFYGLFSNLNVMLWASSAAVNFLGASLMKNKDREFYFMFCSGMFITWLALDDLFMFHESVFPNYFHILENNVYLGYLCIILAYLFYFRRDIYNCTNYIFLIVALSAFGSSILIDLFWGFTFAEDGAKFLGVIIWTIYYFDTARVLISKQMSVNNLQHFQYSEVTPNSLEQELFK